MYIIRHLKKAKTCKCEIRHYQQLLKIQPHYEQNQVVVLVLSNLLVLLEEELVYAKKNQRYSKNVLKTNDVPF